MDIYQAVKDFGAPTAALIVVCYVLYLIVTRLCVKFDALIEAFKGATGDFMKRMDTHESNAVKRHGEVITKIDKAVTGIEEIKDRLPAGGRHKKADGAA